MRGLQRTDARKSQNRPRGSVSSWRRTAGTSRAASRRPVHAKAGRRRGLGRAIILFVCAFALASGTAAFAYTTASGNGTGQAQAVTLHAPGAGGASNATPTSLIVHWIPSPGLPSGGGYLVLRGTSPGGPYTKVTSGMCQQATTLVSSADSCADTGLQGGTTYYYEIEGAFYDVQTLWASAPDAAFSGTTSEVTIPIQNTPGEPPPSVSAPVVTSANSTTLFTGTPGTFQVTASGSPAPRLSDTPFSGCTPSTLPSGVTFTSGGLLSGTPALGTDGTYALCITAANGVGPAGTQSFTLTIATATLVLSSPPVSGAGSSTPNLGPITVRRQTGSGAPITSGGALTVSLTSSAQNRATFGTTQFTSEPVSSVTIPSGESTATFWFGSPAPVSPTITVSAAGYASGTQTETIMAPPTGLGLALAAGSTGSPALSCGPPSAHATCTVTGVGVAGTVALSVSFWDAGGNPVPYSNTQPATIGVTGPDNGGVTIGAGASGSGAAVLTAAVGTSTLSYGPYTMTIDVTP